MSVQRHNVNHDENREKCEKHGRVYLVEHTSQNIVSFLRTIVRIREVNYTFYG